MNAYREGAAVVGLPLAAGGGLDGGFFAGFADGEAECGARSRRSEVVRNRDVPTGCAGRGRARSGSGSRAMPREKVAIGSALSPRDLPDLWCCPYCVVAASRNPSSGQIPLATWELVTI